jgi:hypothetical protein
MSKENWNYYFKLIRGYLLDIEEPEGSISNVTHKKKVFIEFILNDDEKVLSDGLRVSSYLKCNCKIP